MKSTDEVCAKYDGRPKIRLEVREMTAAAGDPGVPPRSVFIETDSEGFEFLAELFFAFAGSGEGCHRNLGPNGPGSAYFKVGCTLGILLHRLPCEHPETPFDATTRRLI